MTILRHRRESEVVRSPPALPAPGGHSRTSSISSASTMSPPLSPSPAAGNMALPGSAPPLVSSPIASPSLPAIPTDPNKKRHLRVPHLGRGSSSDVKPRKEAEKKPTASLRERAVSAPSQSPQPRAPVMPFVIPTQTELVYQYNRDGFVVPSTAEVYECDATVQTLAYGTPRPVLASEIFRCPSYTTAVPKSGRGRGIV